jgi:hypothetical protein
VRVRLRNQPRPHFYTCTHNSTRTAEHGRSVGCTLLCVTHLSPCTSQEAVWRVVGGKHNSSHSLRLQLVKCPKLKGVASCQVEQLILPKVRHWVEDAVRSPWCALSQLLPQGTVAAKARLESVAIAARVCTTAQGGRRRVEGVQDGDCHVCAQMWLCLRR